MARYVTLEEVVSKRPVNERRVKRLKNQLLVRNSAARLAELRKSLNLTQIELAKRVGVDQAHVSRIESGNFFELEFSTLERYIEALGGKIEVRARFGENSLLLLDSKGEKNLKKSLKKKPRHGK
ncbi:MAG: helix-turn-helix domain-containing protein [Actinomycetota bacterium]